MEKEFVPYGLAVKLKELGFNEPCFGYYLEDGTWVPASYSKKGTVYPSNTDLLPDWSAAPTYSQAFRWFREKYNLFGYSYPNDYQMYGYRIVEVKSPENKELIYDWGTKNTNEEAESACLDKLIEMKNYGKTKKI